MIRCAACDWILPPGTDRCPRCGSAHAKEQLFLPEVPQPEDWQKLPARVRLSWSEMPSIQIVHGLRTSGAFSSSRSQMLTGLRESGSIVTRAMSYREVREWLSKHDALVTDADWEVEVCWSEQEWKPAPRPLDS